MNATARIARAGSLSLAVILAGCAVGPRYVRPEVEAPPAYKEQAQAPGPDDASWTAARPDDEAPRGSWWAVFDDPQLDALENQVGAANQSLEAAEAQFRQARALAQAARAGRFPTVSVDPSITRSHPSANRSIRPSIAASTFNDNVLPLDLDYEVDLWGRVRLTVQQSGAAAQASAADLEALRLSLQAELAVDYYTLRGLDAERQLLDSAVVAYDKALQLTKNRYDAGVAAMSEVALAETQLQTTRAQAVDTGVARSSLEHAIATLTGRPAPGVSLPSTPLAGSPPKIPPALPSALLERRPDIAAAERRMAAANAGIGIARAAFFPTLSLTGSAGYESTRMATWLTWPSRFWSIGPALAETIFDGGRRRAASRQAVAAYDQSVAVYRGSVLAAFQEVEDNLAALRILDEEAALQSAAVKAADRSLDLSLNRYKGGITTYLEVITAQTAELTNARAAVDVLQRRMIASVLLIKALGGGWEAADLPSLRDLRASGS